MNSSRSNRNKILKNVAYAGVFILLMFELLVPGWWKNGDLHQFKNWYPSSGSVIFIAVKYLLPLYFICGIIFLSIFHFEWIKNKICFLLEKLKQFFSKIWSYSFQDVLPTRKFISDFFLRTLTFIYFIAFASVLWQFPLISENGLVPFRQFAAVTYHHEGWISIFNFPSVFWISQADFFVKAILFLGCIISLLATFTRKRTIYYVILWFFYLSIVTFGREFFAFPWDTFLLEIGFLSLFVSYFIQKFNQLPRLILFALCLLFFRQWFSMAMTKILWSDTAWHDLTYMKYFWLNQPSPTPFARYMYQLPMLVQKILTALTLILEASIPLAMFFGRKGRIIAFLISLFLSLMIELSGNYGFFNLITVILGFWCLDDRFFKRKEVEFTPLPLMKLCFVKVISGTIFGLIISFNVFYVALQFSKQSDHPLNYLNYYFFDESQIPQKNAIVKPFFEIGKFFSRFRIVAPHGVFKGIPKERLNLQIQVKRTGNDWENLEFNKGTSVMNYHFSAPVMERLPFIFFYKSYGIEFEKIIKINTNSKYFNSWMKNLVVGILSSNKEIDKLIGSSGKGKVEEIRWILNDCIPVNTAPHYKNQPLDTAYLNLASDCEIPVIKRKN